MSQLCTLRILNKPETIVPGCDSSFVCITTDVQAGMRWWKFRLSFQVGESFESPSGDFQTPDIAEIVDRLYSWSRKEQITKFIFMTPEAAEMLRPHMATPAVEYRLEGL